MAELTTFDTYEVDSLELDYSQFGQYENALLDENDDVIDYNGEATLGTGLSKDARGEILSAQLTAQSTIDAAVIESQTASH